MMIKVLTMAVGVVSMAMVGACAAHADHGSPKFPDLSSYVSVDAADYVIDTTTPGMPSARVYFVTPDGIACDIDSSSAGCQGNNFPGIAPQRWDPSAGITGVNTISTNSGLGATNAPYSPDRTVHGQNVRTLPPFHTITVGEVVCGVDDAKMTACKDSQGRGFILSPAWSGGLKG